MPSRWMYGTHRSSKSRDATAEYVEHRALSCTTGSHDRHELSRGYGSVHTLDNRGQPTLDAVCEITPGEQDGITEVLALLEVHTASSGG